MTSIDKTGILIAWLEEERIRPTPTSRGLGGGDINSSYIQLQIIKALAEEGDPLALREVASDINYDPAISDGASIALGFMGDTSQITRLINILENHEEPCFRVGAAEALGSLGAVSAISVLQKSLQDEYSVFGDIHTPPGLSTIFPVRDAARVAINVLTSQSKDLKAWILAKQLRFEQRLDMSRQAACAVVRELSRKRIQDIVWLNRTDRLDLSSVDRSEILFSWLIRETRYSKQEINRLGIDMDKRSCISQLITKLVSDSNPLLLREIVLDSSADADTRDFASLILGYMGDQSQTPKLIHILNYQQDILLKARATEALGLLGAVEAIPALQKARDYHPSTIIANSGNTQTEYPLRECSEKAISNLREDTYLNKSKELTKRYITRIEYMNTQMVDLRSSLVCREWQIKWNPDKKIMTAAKGTSRLQIQASTGTVTLNGQIMNMKARMSNNKQIRVPESLIAILVYRDQPLSLLAKGIASTVD